MDSYFEQGPIRPPSEAHSLLLRLTRNCPWNKCAFCHTYSGAKFELRSVAEIKADIQTMKDIADEISSLSVKLGRSGRIDRNVLQHIFAGELGNNEFISSIAVWLYFGGENVFLQDADSLIMKTPQLLEILEFLNQQFPRISRITSYCRSHTAARKSVDDFRQLRQYGLSRIHVGLESGCDEVLAMIQKGVTSDEQTKAGLQIRQAGIELSVYFMPGLGGVKLTENNAIATAAVINAINPHFIRLRTLHIVPGTKLDYLREEGEFIPLSDEAILKEIKIFIANLNLQGTHLVSDHILNLLEEIEGVLPEEKQKMLSLIDQYFALPEKERLIYRLGRRCALLKRMADLSDNEIYNRLERTIAGYSSPEELENNINFIMNNYI